MSEDVTRALDVFMQKYQASALIHPEMLRTEFDEQWPSSCYSSVNEEGGIVSWQPVKRTESANLDDLASALNMPIHPDIIKYYASYWSNHLDAKSAKGNLQLLQAWNQDDFERLQQNLVGHILMKRRLKQPETLFFALTDEDDFILTVDNQTGEVMLEQVGLIPKQVLSPNLATFIDTLEPSTVNAV